LAITGFEDGREPPAKGCGNHHKVKKTRINSPLRSFRKNTTPFDTLVVEVRPIPDFLSPKL
jgi:hypothetical protein